MTSDKGLDALEERTADPDDRREKEVAVLATLAKEGPASDFFGTFEAAYMAEALNFPPELDAVALALRDMMYSGKPADLGLILDALQAKGKRVPEADVRAILDPANARPPAVAGEYVKGLVSLEMYRKAEAIGGQYQAALADAREKGLDGTAAAADLLKNLHALTYDEKRGIFKPLKSEADEMPGFLDILASRRTDGREWSGLDSGFRHFNEVFNGLQGLIVLAAAPSCGKTTLAKQIADNVAEKEKVPVLFFSYEQGAEELRIKSLARLSKVNSRMICKGRGDATAWGMVKEAADKYRQGPGSLLKIVEADGTFTPDRIRGLILAEKVKRPGRVLVVIDYLQLVPAADPQTGRPFPSVKERMDFVLSELRRISRDLDAVVLTISSMNREGYKEKPEGGSNKNRGAKKPSLAVLKESGGIEYGADIVVCLVKDYKESAEMTERANKGKKDGDPNRQTLARVEAYVLKNRNGELATIHLDFMPAWAEFETQGKPESLAEEEIF